MLTHRPTSTSIKQSGVLIRQEAAGPPCAHSQANTHHIHVCMSVGSFPPCLHAALYNLSPGLPEVKRTKHAPTDTCTHNLTAADNFRYVRI